MALWIFKCFLSEAGTDLIDDWYRDLPEAAQSKIDTILEHLRDTPHVQWPTNIVKPVGDGILEIRFQVRNVLHRPLGFFGPDRGEFTFLTPAREQGNRFVPPNARGIAIERMEIVLMNKGRARECQF